MSQPYCPACYPNKIRSHAGIYFGAMLDVFLQAFTSKKARPQLPRFPKWLSLTHWFYRGMEFIHVVRFSRDFDKKDHYPRSWVIIQEAQRRGIPIESIRIFGRMTTYYRMKFGSKRYYYDAIPSRFLHLRLDEKAFVKRTCMKYGFPVSEGKLFLSALRGIRYGKKLGFPLAVKPASGTHAYHVTAPVSNAEELARAIKLAKQYHPQYIVERYLIGALYRVTVINFHHVYIARRVAPNIVGDGVHSIRELIEIKNADPSRGETGQKDATLHKIALPTPLLTSPRQGEEANQFPLLPEEGLGVVGATTTDVALAHVGIDPEYVPAQGQHIALHSKISIGSGGDIIEETLLLHPENREMFRRAARLFGTDLVGFDVIADDLSHPYAEQNIGIIEANSIPMIDFHHNPAEGAPQSPATALLNGIIADKRVRYLYPVMLPQRSLGTRVMWHFLDVTMPLARDFLLQFRLVRRLARRQRFPVGWLRPDVRPEQAITHLKMNGFEVVRPEWIDHGEIIGLRKLLDHERQCHVRFFEDGEVRAHVEYAPEARPIVHLLERGFHPANDIVHEFLHEFVELREKNAP